MKNFPHATSTLTPVRRVAACFAFLGFLTLASCGEKEKTHLSLLKEQTEVVQEIEATVGSTLENRDQDLSAVADRVVALIARLKELKREAGELPPPTIEEQNELVAYDDLARAHRSLADLFQSHLSDDPQPDLSGFQELMLLLHDSAPLVNEGRPVFPDTP